MKIKRLLAVIAILVFGWHGKALRAQNAVALTPPMGWNSWNTFECEVTDAKIRAAADAIAANGMKEAGYAYINIDDCWQGKRSTTGEITSNERFPDMKALAGYVHSRGLRIGIYSSPGKKTCAGYEGSYGHESQDAKTYAAWGFDYLKYDWCSAEEVYKDSEMPAVYKLMSDALKATGRPFVYSLCQYGREDVWKWGAASGGNLWRTTNDIRPNYMSILALGFAQQDGLGRFAGPGHWNDPDMLEVGNGKLTLAENKLHFSLWAMLAAPLLAGNDLTQMKPEILNILTNREVIAVDQDPRGVQGHRVWQDGPVDVWERPLANDEAAIALFNKGESAATVTVSFRELGLAPRLEVRDLWAHKDLGAYDDTFSMQVPTHGVAMLRVKNAAR